MIHFIGKVSAVSIILFIICGCATVNTPSTYENEAGFYTSNFPNMKENDKAQMIIDQMKAEGRTPTVVEKEVTIKIVKVYNEAGTQIWPVKYSDNASGTIYLDNMSKRLKELEARFDDKNVEKDDDN